MGNNMKEMVDLRNMIAGWLDARDAECQMECDQRAHERSTLAMLNAEIARYCGVRP